MLVFKYLSLSGDYGNKQSFTQKRSENKNICTQPKTKFMLKKKKERNANVAFTLIINVYIIFIYHLC